MLFSTSLNPLNSLEPPLATLDKSMQDQSSQPAFTCSKSTMETPQQWCGI